MKLDISLNTARKIVNGLVGRDLIVFTRGTGPAATTGHLGIPARTLEGMIELARTEALIDMVMRAEISTGQAPAPRTAPEAARGTRPAGGVQWRSPGRTGQQDAPRDRKGDRHVRKTKTAGRRPRGTVRGAAQRIAGVAAGGSRAATLLLAAFLGVTGALALSTGALAENGRLIGEIVLQ